MARSYLSYQENISTSLQARSRLVVKYENCIAFIWDEKFSLHGTEISLADRRDLGDRDNFYPI